eukprot:gene25757-11421_t
MEGGTEEASSSDRVLDGTDDDGLAETDPEGRFLRYKEVHAKGRFKQVYKSFDSSIGIDVAWSKISSGSSICWTNEQLHAVAHDMQKGLELDHPNIIKSFKCWEDSENRCVNLVSELFTSGNLRQYRNLHKHLDLKAVKRMGRQILKGLVYLHSMQPPLTHGDLRCDKIYVNGHLGEIKIGDLGLESLMPYRWDCKPQASVMDESADVFAFGLCLLELLTLQQLDPQHCSEWEEQLQLVTDLDSKLFISKCLSPDRPTAAQLSEDAYFSLKKTIPQSSSDQGLSGSSGGKEGGGATGERHSHLVVSSRSLNEAVAHEKRMTEEGMGDDSGAPIAVGKLRGEDYNFEFAGKVKDNKMHFRLVMTQAVVDVNDAQPFIRTVDFVFDPEIDTADNLAAEISEEFNLSPTDTEICAAALREWLAKEMPNLSESGQ